MRYATFAPKSCFNDAKSAISQPMKGADQESDPDETMLPHHERYTTDRHGDTDEVAHELQEETHLTFGKEFTEAVEAKQVAQQEAERARFIVEKAEQQKKAAIISAEGDSKAAELIATSLAEVGDGLIELRKLEAAEDIAYQLSRSRNVTYLPPGQSTLLQLPQ
ncbi:unnamed protein product [Ranitomeya imitator]|uniref:Prohibitin n=1 Tax=Ranitomeya imitator TaxID=111125 RepID=A0ABN9L1U6_9NEOB|nr:unnamed protein product [Ranitomeya imitator]